VGRRLAAIDLGTNTVRLLVAEVDGAAWRSLHQAQRVTRLGQGLGAAGLLQDGPMARTVAAVGEFVTAARRRGAERIRIVATSAVREAANGSVLAARVRGLTGERVEVISGTEEARLSLLGVAASLPALRGSFLLLDIGGGSTELVLARERAPLAAVSLRLGVVGLAERFADTGPLDAARFESMRRELAARLAAEIPEGLVVHDAPVVVGTAGSITTLAALDLGLSAYDPARVHGHTLTRAALERRLGHLAPLSLAERARIPCVEPGRADLLVPGIALCLGVLDRLGRSAILVSDHGLREGVLWDALHSGRA
jgi:exopolyphosphatase/guanosine-5'-triphosphate,3'-diphosphate pyrophosphatase